MGGQWVIQQGFYGGAMWANVLKAIVLSYCLSNYRNLFNLHHLVHRWCTTTHTFFLSYGEITVTLEDMVNQLLLPILSDVDPVPWNFLWKKRPWRPSWRRGWVATWSCHTGLGLSLRPSSLLAMRPSSCFGSVSSFLALILTMLWSLCIFS